MSSGEDVCILCNNLTLEEERIILSCPHHVICSKCFCGMDNHRCPSCKPFIVADAIITVSWMYDSYIKLGDYIDALCIFCGYYCTTYANHGYEINMLMYPGGTLYFCDVCAKYYHLLTHQTEIHLLDDTIILAKHRMIQKLNQ